MMLAGGATTLIFTPDGADTVSSFIMHIRVDVTSHSMLLWNEVTWNPLGARLAGTPLPRDGSV